LLVLICLPRARGTVKQHLSVSVDQIPAVNVRVQCKTPSNEPKWMGNPWEMYLLNMVEDALRDTGLAESWDNERSKYVLICSYTHGFCFPYLDRHMAPHFDAVRRADFLLSDRTTGAVLARAEFQRRLLAPRPADHVFQSLLFRMLSGEKKLTLRRLTRTIEQMLRH